VDLTDLPPEPAPTWDGMFYRIETALAFLPADQRRCLHIHDDHQRTLLTDAVRSAFAPQLRAAEEATETLNRLKTLLRKRRFDQTIPLRDLQDVLYGEDR
jgi:hypothetical protein